MTTELLTETLTTIESLTEPVTSIYIDETVVQKLDMIVTLLLISFVGLIVFGVCYVLYKAVNGFISFP